jgi:hypothetical protein
LTERIGYPLDSTPMRLRLAYYLYRLLGERLSYTTETGHMTLHPRDRLYLPSPVGLRARLLLVLLLSPHLDQAHTDEPVEQ